MAYLSVRTLRMAPHNKTISSIRYVRKILCMQTELGHSVGLWYYSHARSVTIFSFPYHLAFTSEFCFRILNAYNYLFTKNQVCFLFNTSSIFRVLFFRRSNIKSQSSIWGVPDLVNSASFVQLIDKNIFFQLQGLCVANLRV